MAKRGNPGWGKPPRALPAGPTEFDAQVARLRLTGAEYVASPELRSWCEHNRNRVYIPEWLLKQWRIEVEDSLSGAAALGTSKKGHARMRWLRPSA